ncbi:CBS domain-containing protein [Burkholderia cenocepacia]|uniref:CBS domain-containing protein n=2 Tax=Burkholderia cenocepacia TaxID=95486 RepID=UPI00286E198F|nr:CBS domain-containing protein [Burkholderia cenocepacia]
MTETSARRPTMHAIDVMTPSVVSVKPDMTVQQTAALLVEIGISGAPVIDGMPLSLIRPCLASLKKMSYKTRG